MWWTGDRQDNSPSHLAGSKPRLSTAFKPVGFQMVKHFWFLFGKPSPFSTAITRFLAHLQLYLLHSTEIQGRIHLTPSEWLSTVNWAISQKPRMFIADKALSSGALMAFQWLIAPFCLVDGQDWLNPSRSSRQRNLSLHQFSAGSLISSSFFWLCTAEVLFVQNVSIFKCHFQL